MDTLFINPAAKPLQFGYILAADTEALRYDIDDFQEQQDFFNIDYFGIDGHSYYENLGSAYLHLWSKVREKNLVTVLFHNATYDFQIIDLMSYIVDKRLFELELKQAMLGNVNFVKFSDRHHTLQFVDTYNYFKTSVEGMGKVLGYPKENPLDYKLKPEKWNTKLKSGMGKSRVQRDTEILYRFFQRFLNNQDFVKGISLASTSFKTFKKNYLKNTITFPVAQIEDALLSYRGGRCEPYVINKIPIELRVYDFNSLYPKVMRDYPVSVKFRREVDRFEFENIEAQKYNYLYNVNYSYGDKPARLPIVIKNTNGMLSQYYAANNVWLTGAELLELYKSSDSLLLTMNKGYEYLNDFIFTDFVDYFYDKRQQTTNEVDRYFYKILLNSLYGKFGQHKRITHFFALADIDEPIRILLNEGLNSVNGLVYNVHGDYVTVTVDLPLAQYNSPIIASEITAYARLMNYRLQKDIGFNHVYYTDTDSVFIDRDWVESSALGGLKQEHKGATDFRIFDAKDYEWFENGIRHFTLKGIKKSAKQLNDIEFEQQKFSTLKSQNHNGVIVELITKTLKREHKKLDYRLDNGNLIGYPFAALD